MSGARGAKQKRLLLLPGKCLMDEWTVPRFGRAQPQNPRGHHYHDISGNVLVPGIPAAVTMTLVFFFLLLSQAASQRCQNRPGGLDYKPSIEYGLT